MMMIIMMIIIIIIPFQLTSAAKAVPENRMSTAAICLSQAFSREMQVYLALY